MSTVRAALTDASGNVTNVIVLDPAGGWAPPKGLTVRQLADTDLVGPGWAYDANGFHGPASLTVDPVTIPPDGTTAAAVTYTNTRADAPTSVTFTANGATKAVTLANGVASLDVSSATPGDTIDVTVDALPGATVTVTVTA